MAMTPEQRKARLQAMYDDIGRVLSGEIPPDAPFGARGKGVADDKDVADTEDVVDEKGLPWWFGPDFHPGADGKPGISVQDSLPDGYTPAP